MHLCSTPDCTRACQLVPEEPLPEPALPSVPVIDAARSRNKLQSQLIVAVLGTAVLLGGLLRFWHTGGTPVRLLTYISLGFGLLAWRFRAATAGAAVFGAVVCFTLAVPQAGQHRVSPLLLALVVLVVLTSAATRFRRSAKEHRGLAEERNGRRASQILANLGVASLCALVGLPLPALAALAEATADTLASEIGQAMPGRTLMLTTLRATLPGTDGGISLVGTLAGCTGALIVSVAGSRSPGSIALAAGAGIFGLLVDSLLGATLERRGLLGNDAVNLASTAAAALFAVVLSAL